MCVREKGRETHTNLEREEKEGLEDEPLLEIGRAGRFGLEVKCN